MTSRILRHVAADVLKHYHAGVALSARTVAWAQGIVTKPEIRENKEYLFGSKQRAGPPAALQDPAAPAVNTVEPTVIPPAPAWGSRAPAPAAEGGGFLADWNKKRGKT